MNLTAQLSAQKEKNEENIPADKWAVMEKSTRELQEQSLSLRALKVGDTLPVFTLSDVNHIKVSLNDFLEDFIVISFYRGRWCPFCNFELKALQGVIPQLQQLNSALVAISPETPDNSLTTAQKNELEFTVLSDINNEYAKSLGLVFQLPEDLRAVYHSFNLDIPKHNQNNDYELPMPATYIVNKSREIIYAFVPEDYTERLAPELILETLEKHQ